MPDKKESILKRWEITEDQLTELIDENPSLRGMLLGYVAEKKFHYGFLHHPDITEILKDDDHDRSKKGDRRIIYKGISIVIEVKSLQTKTVKKTGIDSWIGKSQVDGSDRRIITFEDGSELNTTLLKRGEFDLLAVNCYAFGDKWRFVFAKNEDLPCSSFKGYTQEQCSKLIASLVTVTWPPEPPYTDNPYILLDQIIAKKKSSAHR